MNRFLSVNYFCLKNPLIFTLLFIFFANCSGFSQIVSPFNARYQNNQKGGITFISNVSVSCGSANGCSAAQQQTVVTGGNSNGAYNQSYVDVDGNATTFMSSSDSLDLANCSEILWAGLYWSARITTNTNNYANRNSVKLRVNNGAYQTLTADQLLDVPTINGASWSHPSYYCFKNITSIVQANGIKDRYTIADLVTQTGSTNLWGGWSIVVVYRNVYEPMRNLTVYDGFANIGVGNSLNIPITGFVTPLLGPVSFELGVIALDGDRDSQGDQLQFNGAGTFLNVSDALHNTNNFFNSMISENGVITPFRNPSYNNSLGYDAGIFSPNNSTYQYLSNGATNATIRISTSSENILSRVITSAIDVYEPDIRASVRITDLNGGQVNPGDVLEYTMVGKNIGSDISVGTFMTDTLDPRVTYVPNSIQVTFGPNLGPKTDVLGDDQGEYIAADKVVKVRIGNGANALNGGQVSNLNSGADSTVIKFQVIVNSDCLIFLCDNTLDNVAYIFGEGDISGNSYDNDGISDLLDANGCPLVASNELTINTSNCLPPSINSNAPICPGSTLSLSSTISSTGIYNWTGPNGFSSTSQAPSIPNVSTLATGNYFLSITYDGLNCSIDTFINVNIFNNPVIQNDSVINVTCFGQNNGSISVNATGNLPLSYSWSNGANTSSISNLAPGSYTVTITSANGCSIQNTYVITQPLILGGSATATSNYSGFNISCFGLSDGSVTVNQSGGTAPYTYLWSTGETTQSINGIPFGTYSVTVTDSNSCSTVATIGLTQPTSLSIIPVVTTNVNCFGGSNGAINLTANGGVTPYSYAWNNGSNQEDLNNLSEGSYSVQITDANGCILNDTYLVSQPALALSSTQSQTNVSCFGGTNGSINVSVIGGTSPYTYLWSDGSMNEDLINIAVGTYTLTITDANGCQLTNSSSITEPAQPISLTNDIDNILCFGDNSGNIDISIQGGTPGYSFNWSNGATTEDLSSLSAGIYSVIVTDTNGCTLNQAFTLIEPAQALSIAGSVIPVTCNGGNNGTINTITQGGTAPYSYSWSNGEITTGLVNLQAGTYTLNVTDANNCQTNSTFQVLQPSLPVTLTEIHSNVSCNGGSDGAINLTVTGGTSPYSFLWSNGELTEDISGLLAGTYSVNVLDTNGCIENISVTITQPNQLAYSGVVTNVLCFNESTGIIDGVTTGGTLPYNYVWSNGTNNEDNTNLSAGNYSITTTDANGCSTINNFTITEPLLPLQVNASQVNVLCFGGNNGSIDLSVSNGTAPFDYIWSNGATIEDLTNLIAGIYTVDVTDANGCTAQLSITITEPPIPLTLNSTQFNIPCFGQSVGSIDLNVFGGTSPFNYLWSNGQITQDLTNLIAGAYSVSVVDFNGCNTTAIFTITQPNSPLIITETHADAICILSQTGSIDLSVSGGTPGYNYQWSNGSTSQDLIGLSAGNYSVTVSDANSCNQNLTIVILDPTNNISLTEVHQDVNCFGGSDGSVDLTINSPNPITSIVWNTGSVSEDISGLNAGIYSVTVTDLLSCSSFLTVAISEPSTPITISSVVSNVTCFGQTNGGINLTVSGGTAPYGYSWSNGSILEDIGNLTAGNYSVLVTDANGCNANFNSIITEPSTPIVASSIQSPVSCFGGNNGSIDLNVSGGVTPYTYSWNNGNTAQDLTNVPAGNYSVVIQDASGCSTSLNAAIAQPTFPLNNSGVITNVNCLGNNSGNINLTVTGGTAPYSFLWNNGSVSQNLINVGAGVYSVLITDINGCVSSGNYQITQPSAQLSATIAVTNVICHNGATGTATVSPTGGTAPYVYVWSNGQNTPFIDSLLAGNISVTVTDAAGCNSVLNAFVSQPSPVVANTTNTNNICYGQSAGNISVVANGGVAPYAYLWNTGSTSTFINNLSAGPYFVQITDANGCTTTFSDTVYQPSNAINVSSNVVDNICFGEANGAIDITINGGTAPYQHLWNTGLISEDLTNLLAGQYTVTVVDNNGCLLMQTISVNQPSGPILITGALTSVSCFAENSGAIDVSISGPNGPFSYLWNDGSITEDLNNLISGNYSLTVENANGCTSTASFNVSEPQPLIVSAAIQQVSCYNASNGAINLAVTGGTSPYTYSWSNGQTIEDLTNIPSGNYSVTITDLNGCFTSGTFLINQPSNYSVSLTPQNVLCFGDNSGQIFSTVTGGTAPYTYLWNTGANTSNISGLTAGNYSLTVFDVNGCTAFANTTLTQPTSATTLTAVISNETCANTPTGSIDLTVNSPTPGFTYFWNNGAATEDINGLIANLYTVNVTDINGCTTTASYQVNAVSPIVSTASITTVDCFNNSTGAIDINVNGGTPNYSFNWSNGATTEDINLINAGVYFVTITDQNNCSQGFSFNVTQPIDSLSLIGLMNPVTCAGGSNGGINLLINGGTPNYAYSWSNNTSGQDLVNVQAGVYSVTVTDINGCSKTESFAVAQPVPLSLVANITNVNCFGGNNGSIDITPTGGIENYTFNWTNGATTEDISNLTANNYQVVITDNNGCTFDSTLSVTQPNSQLNLSLVATNVSCFGDNNGSVDLTISGGTLPYTINWNNGQITEDIQNLIGGTFTVTVVDSNGCSSTASINVNTPLAPLSLTAVVQDVSCFNGSNGQINITPTGGTAPYTYSWSNTATTQDLINVSAGNYSVIVTDNQGCSINGSYGLTQPSSAILITSSLTPVSCFGGNDGAINTTINGGIQPYTISWSNGASTEDLTSLSTGSYTITVSDPSGCSINSTFNISQPLSPLSIVANLDAVSCFGFTDGAIDVSASGGTPAYTYSWSNNSTTEDIQTLSEGAYSLTITDANGCQIDSTFSLLQPSALTASSLNTNVLCFGASTGAINLSVFGGIFPYTYSWSNGSINQDLQLIPAGSYSVIISDANGCDVTYSTSITEPNQALTLTETHQNVLCFGANNGSINLTATGGTPNYSYVWSNGASTQDIANLVAGNYTVNVLDANNCPAALTITVQQPSAPLTISSNITNVDCFGLASGAIDITINGGTAPFTYFWNTGSVTQDLVNIPAGQYTLAVTDANNCVSSTIFTLSQPATPINAVINSITDASCFGYSDGSASVSVSGGTPAYNILWSNGATTSFANGLSAGTYTATITDANGCENVLNVIVNQPPGIIPSFSYQINGTCSPATVQFINTSDGSPTNCIWQMGNGQTISNCSSFDFIYDMPGCYSVTLTTSLNNGCVSSVTIDSLICVQQGPTADFIIIPSADVYYSGDVQFNNSSLNADFYFWDFGDNSPISNELNPQHDYGSMNLNTYEVTLVAQDSAGCVDTSIILFTIEQDFIVYAPNSMTLDNNGVNESFIPVFSDISKVKYYNLLIFNRWGELIWQTTDKYTAWDGIYNGNRCQDGVYTWKLTYTRIDNYTEILVGHVNLLR